MAALNNAFMYRGSGLLLLLVGATLTYTLAFAPFEEPVRRWTTAEGEGLVQAKVECPSAWAAVFEHERLDTHLRTEADQCVRAARTHLTGAIVVAAFAAALGMRGVLRGPAPRPEPLRPLSESLRWRSDESERGPAS